MQFNYEKFNRARQQNHLLSGDEASSTEMLGLPVSSSAPDMDAQDRKDVTPQKTRGSSSTSLFSGKRLVALIIAIRSDGLQLSSQNVVG